VSWDKDPGVPEDFARSEVVSSRSRFGADHESPAVQGELKLDVGNDHAAIEPHTPAGSAALRIWSSLTERYWPFCRGDVARSRRC
jgi:hypothetical protein